MNTHSYHKRIEIITRGKKIADDDDNSINNEWMKVQWFKVRSKTPCKQVRVIKSLDGSRVRGISPVGKEKVYGEAAVLSSEWNTERVREDASGDSEDGEDDELSCVMDESAGDCVWRGSRRSVGSYSYKIVRLSSILRQTTRECEYFRSHDPIFWSCDLDVDPATLIDELDLDIVKMYQETENKRFRSRHLNFRAQTCHTDTIFPLWPWPDPITLTYEPYPLKLYSQTKN